MKAKLFLLKADFIDLKISNDSMKYFCPHCAYIEGLLSYYPKLRQELEINYVDFHRPRKKIVEILGENNQSCPSLIIERDLVDAETLLELKSYSNFKFTNDTRIIAKYFHRQFKIGIEHP